MKKKLIVLGLLILGVGIFVTVLRSADWQDIVANLSQITFGKFLLFMAFAQISFAIFNLRWKILLKCHGHDIPFWTLWLYRAAGYGVSYITPTQVGGEPVRIYLLHENHGIKLREATASVLLDKLIELSAFIAFVASGIFVVSFTNLIPKNSLHLFSALIVVFVGLSIYVFKKLLDGEGFLTTLFNGLRLNKVKKLQRFEKKIHRTENLITKFLNHSQHKRSTLPIIIGLSLLGWAFTIGEYYMLARFVGVGLGGYESFLIATIPSVAYLLPMPAGLGMLESAQVGLFSLLGYSAGSALAVMVMVRVKELFFSGVGFAYALTHGLTLLGKESTKKQFVKGPTGLKPRKITRIGIKKILQQTKASV